MYILYNSHNSLFYICKYICTYLYNKCYVFQCHVLIFIQMYVCAVLIKMKKYIFIILIHFGVK